MKTAEVLGRLAVIIALTVFATLYTVGIFTSSASAQYPQQEGEHLDDYLQRMQDMTQTDMLREQKRNKAVDLELRGERYYILWSNGQVTGNTLLSGGGVLNTYPSSRKP